MMRHTVTYPSRGRDYDAIVPGAHSVLHDVAVTPEQQSLAARRVRKFARRNALDSADLAELLAMLGLVSP